MRDHPEKFPLIGDQMTSRRITTMTSSDPSDNHGDDLDAGERIGSTELVTEMEEDWRESFDIFFE